MNYSINILILYNLNMLNLYIIVKKIRKLYNSKITFILILDIFKSF